MEEDYLNFMENPRMENYLNNYYYSGPTENVEAPIQNGNIGY